MRWMEDEFEVRLTQRIAQRVADLRQMRGLGREDLAEILGVTADNIGKLERGERRYSVAELVLLATEMDCTVNDLIYEKPSRERTLKKARMKLG